MRFVRLAAPALILGMLALPSPAHAQFGALKKKIKDRVSASVDKATESDAGKAAETADQAASAGASQDASGGGSIKAYQNYDFVPGDTIVFEDDFRSDQEGELPAHWRLIEGQGTANTIGGIPTMVLTDGLAAALAPRIKSQSYLGDTFTIEFDFLPSKEAWEGMKVTVHYPKERTDGADVGGVRFAPNGSGASVEFPGYRFAGEYPPMRGKIGYGGEGGFWEHWHHGAIAFKNHTMKAYIDQYRVVTAPDVPVTPTWVTFGGRSVPSEPVRFTNVRIANGGGMNLVDEITRNGRIITHGITFDVKKSDVKPQSMGTINQIVNMMKADPSLKFEIGGHTDSDGSAAANMTLSQARADAIKQVLVEQGIDASRLTTKGYGASKPIAPNTTPEGKANNRRVEFVKL